MTIKRTYPLELVLTAHGTAELQNADEEILWSSDSDDDFREEIPSDFLEEEDFADILEYLLDANLISQRELDFFANDTWDCSVETLDQNGELDDDDDESDEDDEG